MARQAVAERLTHVEAGEVLSSVVGAETQSRLNKARCIASAVAQLEQRVDEAVVIDVLGACACDFSQRRIAAIQRLYTEALDLPDFWACLKESGLMGGFELSGGWVLFIKNPYRPDLQGHYPDDPFAWYCHCGSIVKPLRGRLSPAICHCGAGYYRPLLSGLFGVPVRVEVRESLVKGDTRCVIAVEIPHTTHALVSQQRRYPHGKGRKT